LLLELEERLRRILGREECIVFPTGWAAGFSSIAGLARPDDVVLMDMLSHNCLQEGARHATTHVYKFAHNNLDDLEKHLRQERDKNAQNGIFVVLESLYSMDSDSPNLEGAIRLAHEYNAITILDVAHDFGAIGERGLGLLETVQFGEVPDLIMGSFSKTFAANGGFIACSRRVRDYLQYFASPHIFSNAISPIQTAVVNRAFDIIFSAEGATLRSRLSKNIRHLREAMEGHGLTVAGIPSPIVPVFVGDEKLARLTARYLEQNGLLANLVEFPAVARGKARFRFQVMATHEDDAFEYAGEAMARSKAQATRQWEEIETASH
jgi:7-keto-8-aminopelargonate synthetase-like enzyme